LGNLTFCGLAWLSTTKFELLPWHSFSLYSHHIYHKNGRNKKALPDFIRPSLGVCAKRFLLPLCIYKLPQANGFFNTEYFINKLGENRAIRRNSNFRPIILDTCGGFMVE
jgi:hypothetical protein